MVKVTSQRQVNGQTSTETRYYISSLPNDAAQTLKAVRSHWGVENALH
jgi:predicted transposase YbfD/YdcC